MLINSRESVMNKEQIDIPLGVAELAYCPKDFCRCRETVEILDIYIDMYI